MATWDKKDAGYRLTEVVLVLVALTLVGFTAWYVRQSQQETNSNYQISKVTPPPKHVKTSQAPALDATFTAKAGNFSVKYPSSWKLTVKSDVVTKTGLDTTAALTSQNNTILTLHADAVQRGGGCMPAAADKPFKAGNACESWEFLSAEPLAIKNVYTLGSDAKGAQKVVPETVSLVSAHYANKQGAATYLLGLYSAPGTTIELNKPNMSAYTPDLSFPAGDAKGAVKSTVFAYAQGTTPTFLKSADADVARAILRTLTVNQ